jgi:hypothetical protein
LAASGAAFNAFSSGREDAFIIIVALKKWAVFELLV